MLKNIFIVIMLVSFFSLSSLSSSLDGNEILKKVDKNLFPQSYESYRKIINIEPDGKKKEFIFYTAKKGTEKVAGLFLSPASEKGRSTLRLGENMWLYIPNVGKPVRITSLQSVVGGVFNNSDILRLDYSVEYSVTKLEDSEKNYILHLKAKTNTVAYDKIRMTVEKKRLLPSKVECMDSSEMLIKTLYFKDVKDFGNGVVSPSVIETDSPFYKGYKSIFIFGKIKAREFSDEVFTFDFMSKMDSLTK
ncbi:MAG: outer membrane lipoprotein-sorting protein [Candidatus Eremiobacterota bacterium]